MLGGQAHATLFKGAEDARWILTRAGFTQEVLASSAAVVQDELGIRPSAFRESGVAMLGVKDPAAEPAANRNGRAWVVRTFGNVSAASLAYHCGGISADGLLIRPEAGVRFGVSKEESKVMQAELEATFQGGSGDLPFGFGYGNVPRMIGFMCRRFFDRDPLPTGLMLTAWREELSSTSGGNEGGEMGPS